MFRDERYRIEELFSEFFQTIDIVEDKEHALECYKKHHKEHGSFYDIVIFNFQDENTFEAITSICQLKEIQFIAVLIDKKQRTYKRTASKRYRCSYTQTTQGKIRPHQAHP